MTPLLDILPGGVLVTTLGRQIRYANAFFRTDLGLDDSTLVGDQVEALLTPAARIFYDTYLHPLLLNGGRCDEVQFNMASGSGDPVPVVACLRRSDQADQAEPLVIWCIMRADNRSRMYEELIKAQEQVSSHARRMQDLAATDALTGLPNRREFDRLTRRDLRSADQSGQTLAMVMIDIDHFKSFNDSHGHAAGDEVLRRVGARLLSIVRSGETVARFGGEEFACCLVGADAEGAEAFARRVHDHLRRLTVEQRQITVSIGIALRKPGGSRDLATLLKQADIALYGAKSAGRNCTMRNSDGNLAICA
jgi:diguanylate cyclase (GGDEF)-like protein